VNNNLRVHVPVMLAEVLDFLAPEPGKIFLDATVGAAQHSGAILKQIIPGGLIAGLDRDSEMLYLARIYLESLDVPSEAWRLFLLSYKDLDKAAEALKIKFDGFDGILFDCGIASLHVDSADRGFSFNKDGPLDFRFNQDQNLDGYKIVNHWPEKELKRIFREYGDERFSGAISRKIGRERKKKKIETTKELADIIKYSIPPKFRFSRKIHPATRVFQAIRMAVNDELATLTEALPKALKSLAVGGVCVVLSYHSGEDRIVKRCFAENAKRSKWDPEFSLLTKKPVYPGEDEVKQTPRARSARLRAIRRLRIENEGDADRGVVYSGVRMP
jgi:16S rRNA (cytosine1402-N4)-methyltransferase